MKLYRLIFLALLVAFAITSCQQSDNSHVQGQRVIRINLATEPPCVDLKKIADSQSQFFALMCQDGLTRKTKDDQVELSLAESVDISQDLKKYRFRLRNLRWSDGTALTAQDFVNSYLELLDPDFPSPYAHLFFDIQGAKAYKDRSGCKDDVGIFALDALNLEILLTAPNPNFLEILSSVHFFPYPEAIAKHNEQYLEGKNNTFISSGPFTVDSWAKRDKIILKKNPLYWDLTNVHLDQLQIYFIEDSQTELGMYERGQLDWVGSPFTSIHQDAIPFLKTRADFHTYPISAVCFYIFNTQIYPYNNKWIRKALSLGIDRKEITDHLFETNPEPAFRFIPSLLGLKHLNQEDPYRKEKALRYFNKGIQDLGISKEDFPPLQLYYHNGPIIHAKIAETVKQQWQNLFDIKTELYSLEWKIYLDALHKSQFSIARSAIAPPYQDPSCFLQLFSEENSSLNYSGWYNPAFVSLLENAKHSSDHDSRMQFYFQAEELLLEEMPVAPLFFYKNCYLKKESIKNVVIDGLNRADFKWATIEQ